MFSLCPLNGRKTHLNVYMLYSQWTIKALTTWTMQFFVTVKASVDDKGERKKANRSVFFVAVALFFRCNKLKPCDKYAWQLWEFPWRHQTTFNPNKKMLKVSLWTMSRHGRQLTIASLLTHRRRGLWSETLYHHKNLWARCQHPTSTTIVRPGSHQQLPRIHIMDQADVKNRAAAYT